MLTLNRACYLYGVGSVGGAFTVFANWTLSHFSSQFAFLAFSPNFEDFFAPMVLGGICALLFAIPISLSASMRAVVLSFIPAILTLTYKFGWFDRVLYQNIDISYFARPESLTTFFIYFLCWGMFISKMMNKEH